MYLYMHERILGQLVGDPTFALPYWDWNTPGRDQLPPIYADPGTSSQPNPLFDQNRGAVAGNQIPPGIVDADGMQPTMSVTSYELPGGFGGTPDTDPQPSAGTLENSPHGPVHIWTGDPTMQSQNPDMGILAFAARDPIFFAHHANIDRVWDLWLNQGGGRANPQESAWGLETFRFYDQNSPSQWVSMAISDTIDHVGSLRYLYQGVPNPASGQAPGLLALTLDVTPRSKESITVPVPAELAANIPVPVAKPVWVLHIHGIEIPPDQQAFLRVFLEKPDADTQTPVTNPSFVGQFVIFAKTKAGPMNAAHQAPAHSHIHNKAFVLTDQQVAMLKAKQKLEVKLVNLGGPLAKISYKRAFLSSQTK
jgi:polyphenol oxidase